jgi:hypothetical protein
MGEMFWIDFEDAAASATSTLKAARMDGDEAPDARLLCKRLAVRLQLVPPHTLRGNHAARYSALGDLIVRRRGLPPQVEGFMLGHELGHRYRRHAGHPYDHSEELWCNAFAGALLVPDYALCDVWRRGHDLGDLVEMYPNVAPTCLALRVGEARLAQILIVQGTIARYVRSHCEPTPDLINLGVEAVHSGRAQRPGLAKAWRLPEAARRAAVFIEAAS